MGAPLIGLCVFLGTRFFLAEEEESKAGAHKRKRKKKKNHLQPEHLGSGVKAVPPEQNGDHEPEAGPGRAQKLGGIALGAGVSPSPQGQSSSEHPLVQPPTHSRRKRPRKRSPRFQELVAEPTVSPLEDLCQGGPDSGYAVVSVPQASPASGAPALKRKRKLRAPLANGSPPTLAWPPPQEEGPAASPADGGDCPATLPPGGRLKKKKGEPSRLDLYNPSAQKTAIFKKRKKMREMLNLVEHSRGLESELKLVQALVRQLGSRQGGHGFLLKERSGALPRASVCGGGRRGRQVRPLN